MSRRTQKNVGVIGLGIIGRRVADNLRRRGFQVFVWNRTPRPFPNFVGSPAELAELCDFVQIFVSDDEALMQMVQQMKPSLHVQHVIMAHSTVAPHTMRNAAEIVKRRGAQFLDAPFTGSKIPAEKGELVYYVAGDEAAYRRARPVLEASSKEIIEIGEIGQATTVKIATNMVTAATVQAAAEALALVHHSGLAPEKFATAMRGNASNSGTLGMKLPKMIEGDFDPHFSVKHMLKDVQIAARMARSYGLTLGATEAARDSLLDEAQSGRADQDFSSLVRFFFPDGLPGEVSGNADSDDAQPTLGGVDEEAAAAQVRPVESPAASAENERAPNEAQVEEAPELEGAKAEETEQVPPPNDEQRENEAVAATPERQTADSPTVEDIDAPALAAATAQDPDDDGSVRAATPTEDRDSTPAEEPKRTQEAVTAADDPKPEPQAVDREPEVTADARDVAEEQADAAEEQVQSTADAGEEPPAAAEQERAPQPADIAAESADAEDLQPPVEPAQQHSESTKERQETAAEVADSPSERQPKATDDAAEELLAGPRVMAAVPPETRTREAGDYELGGEPPREHRPNGERHARPTEAPPEREEVAARRSFLSRMFGKGDDY